MLLAGLTLLPEVLAERNVVAIHADRVVETNEAYRRIFATFNVVAAGFVLIGGVVADRVSAPRALRFFAMVHLLAIAALWTADSITMFFFASALFAAGQGGVAAANAAVLGEYFGRRQFATLLGTNRLCVGVASKGGTLATALLFDATEGLIGVMAVATILALAAVAAYSAVGNPQPSPSQRAAAAIPTVR